jgi:DNA-binding response OmpR family regulator
MLKILIAEDEKKIRELLKIYFLREGYKVSEAENGRTALEMMKEEIFDIVLLDIYMPELNGFDTCREIRKTSNIPVVILTALSDDESQLLAYETGADDFIIKPFKKDILLAKIRRISERITVNRHSYKFGVLEIDKDSYKVLIDSKEVKFAPKE